MGRGSEDTVDLLFCDESLACFVCHQMHQQTACVQEADPSLGKKGSTITFSIVSSYMIGLLKIGYRVNTTSVDIVRIRNLVRSIHGIVGHTYILISFMGMIIGQNGMSETFLDITGSVSPQLMESLIIGETSSAEYTKSAGVHYLVIHSDGANIDAI